MVTLDQAGWNRAQISIRPTPPFLSAFVEFLWIDERPRCSPRSHEWRIVADDAPHVIYSRFSTAEGEFAHRLHVVGARTRYTDVDCSRRLLTIGARLRPGALPALFDVAAYQLTNRSVPADAFVKAPARDALCDLELARQGDALTLVESFIGKLVAAGGRLDARAQQLGAIAASDTRTVRDVAFDIGVGERALRSWSVSHLGLGLRRFLGIRRLHTALELRLRNPRETWSRIAAATGFADQPHFVRDCRAMLGEAPSKFFARASRGTGS